MSTQTQTSTTANTETISQKVLDAGGVFWVADKKKDSSAKQNDVAEKSHHKTFFPLNTLGLAAPPLPVLAIPVLIAYYRTIPSWDIFFSIAFPLYLGLANRFRFDNNAKLFALRNQQGKAYPAKPEWFEQNNQAWFMHYMLFAATLGVILPIVVQLLAPSSIAQASAPHLYLLVCQIMMEHMVHNPRFHPMLQVINPIGYSAYRMATVTTWAIAAWEMLPAAEQGSILSWETMHLLLAGSNALFWFYNTFVMLLLRVLPPCLDQSKFLDADVSWDKHFQIVPVVNRTEEQEDAKKSN